MSRVIPRVTVEIPMPRGEDLRDRFAMAALTGLLSASAGSIEDFGEQGLFAANAYIVADAMLAERKKNRPQAAEFVATLGEDHA